MLEIPTFLSENRHSKPLPQSGANGAVFQTLKNIREKVFGNDKENLLALQHWQSNKPAYIQDITNLSDYARISNKLQFVENSDEKKYVRDFVEEIKIRTNNLMDIKNDLVEMLNDLMFSGHSQVVKDIKIGNKKLYFGVEKTQSGLSKNLEVDYSIKITGAPPEIGGNIFDDHNEALLDFDIDTKFFFDKDKVLKCNGMIRHRQVSKEAQGLGLGNLAIDVLNSWQKSVNSRTNNNMFFSMGVGQPEVLNLFAKKMNMHPSKSTDVEVLDKMLDKDLYKEGKLLFTGNDNSFYQQGYVSDKPIHNWNTNTHESKNILRLNIDNGTI